MSAMPGPALRLAPGMACLKKRLNSASWRSQCENPVNFLYAKIVIAKRLNLKFANR
jgi:hypothetical protein